MTERLRVAQVVSGFAGALDGVALRGARQLDPHRYAVTVLSGAVGRLADEVREAGMTYVPLTSMRTPSRVLDDVAAYAELAGLLRRGRYDIVHSHGGSAGAVGRVAAHRLGVPAVVHTFHALPDRESTRRPHRAAHIMLERQLGRLTHRFFAIGSEMAALAIRLRIANTERIVAIPSTVDPSMAPATLAAKRAARRTIGVPPGMKVVGAIGHLDAGSAVDDFVDAITKLARPDVFAIWAGSDPSQKRAETLVRRRGLAGNVRFMGAGGDMAPLLAAFDIFVMCGRGRSSPGALLEAMACEVPVVAVAVDGVPELVVPGRTGLLVPPADSRALAASIAHLIDHPELRQQLAAAGRREATSSRFAPELLGRALTETYELLIGRRGARGPVLPDVPGRAHRADARPAGPGRGAAAGGTAPPHHASVGRGRTERSPLSATVATTNGHVATDGRLAGDGWPGEGGDAGAQSRD